MKPIPTDPLQQHARFIDALTQDWLDAGTVTRVTPKADRVLEIARQHERNVRILLGEEK